MRASVPDGDLAAIIGQAVSEKLERLEARRFAKTKHPRQGSFRTDTGSRHIPAAVRRAVHERDQGRCRFVDQQGRRCAARDRLEFHHRRPFAHGGDCRPENVQLLCRSHNLYLAEADYGKQAIARHQRPPDRVSEASAVYSTAGLTPRGT
jgi:predicted restriction endonuclease